MNNHPAGDMAMGALFAAICGLLLAVMVLLTLRLDRSRHAKVERARQERLPSSE